jgi:ribosomal protein S18 acetylase RimI-like enzyme
MIDCIKKMCMIHPAKQIETSTDACVHYDMQACHRPSPFPARRTSLFANAGQGEGKGSITITRISGDEREVKALADIGATSFHSLFRWMFDGKPDELRQLFTIILSPTETFVARIGNRVVGTAVTRTYTSDCEADEQLQGFLLELEKLNNWKTFFLRFLMFVLDYRPQKDEMYIGKLAVAEDQRGQGVGKALMQYVYDMAADMNVQHVTLHVKIENTDAKRLYNREGFVDEKTEAFPWLFRPLLHRIYGITGVHFLRKTLVPASGVFPDASDRNAI